MRNPFAGLSWPKEVTIRIWGDWTIIFPLRTRCAIWNWMFELKGDRRVDWRKCA